MLQGPQFEGFTSSVARGDRGARTAKYIIVYEIESIEAGNRYFPASNVMSEEAQRIRERAAPALEKLGKLCSSTFTDCVVIGDNATQ